MFRVNAARDNLAYQIRHLGSDDLLNAEAAIDPTFGQTTHPGEMSWSISTP